MRGRWTELASRRREIGTDVKEEERSLELMRKKENKGRGIQTDLATRNREMEKEKKRRRKLGKKTDEISLEVRKIHHNEMKRNEMRKEKVKKEEREDKRKK